MEAGGEEGVGMLGIADDGASGLQVQLECSADPIGHFFIFLFKDGAGAVDE